MWHSKTLCLVNSLQIKCQVKKLKYKNIYIHTLVSIYCVISLAVERYLSVCRPQHMDKVDFLSTKTNFTNYKSNEEI